MHDQPQLSLAESIIWEVTSWLTWLIGRLLVRVKFISLVNLLAGRAVVPAGKDEIVRKLEESQHKRKTTQPAASSAGCIFKNPDSIPAGKLVDELGLKNCAIGKARVSEVHGNFIVNDGGATAAEMLELIAKIQGTAREKRGVELQTEVQIVGEEG